MPTYLLTWNPNRWEWDDLSEVAGKTTPNEPYEMRWSCGNRKNIQIDDRLFLIRQGEEPRGIIAAGTATGEVKPDNHWDEAKSRKALFVMVSFDRIIDPTADAPLSVYDITSGPIASVHWGTQSSGIQIPDDAAEFLEELWSEHVGGLDRANAEIMVDPDADVFPEGRVLFRLHRLRERNQEVINKAKATAKKKDGRLSCCVCKFDFEAAYGNVGEDFIEGHHTKPLSELAGETETKVSDIALVCSNCHRMLHRRRPWLGIEDLLALWCQQQSG